jgi:hypothetical protein
MQLPWKPLCDESRKWLKAAALAIASLAALYIGALQPLQKAREVAEQRATGLAASRSMQLYQKGSFDRLVSNRSSGIAGGVIGGVPEGVSRAETVQMASMLASAPPPPRHPLLRMTLTANWCAPIHWTWW